MQRLGQSSGSHGRHGVGRGVTLDAARAAAAARGDARAAPPPRSPTAQGTARGECCPRPRSVWGRDTSTTRSFLASTVGAGAASRRPLPAPPRAAAPGQRRRPARPPRRGRRGASVLFPSLFLKDDTRRRPDPFLTGAAGAGVTSQAMQPAPPRAAAPGQRRRPARQTRRGRRRVTSVFCPLSFKDDVRRRPRPTFSRCGGRGRGITGPGPGPGDAARSATRGGARTAPPPRPPTAPRTARGGRSLRFVDPDTTCVGVKTIRRRSSRFSHLHRSRRCGEASPWAGALQRSRFGTPTRSVGHYGCTRLQGRCQWRSGEMSSREFPTKRVSPARRLVLLAHAAARQREHPAAASNPQDGAAARSRPLGRGVSAEDSHRGRLPGNTTSAPGSGAQSGAGDGGSRRAH